MFVPFLNIKYILFRFFLEHSLKWVFFSFEGLFGLLGERLLADKRFLNSEVGYHAHKFASQLLAKILVVVPEMELDAVPFPFAFYANSDNSVFS